MAVSYTTDKLIASIKRRGSLPTDQRLMSDQDFVNLATDELETLLVPLLMSVREEYFLAYKDISVTGSLPYTVEIPDDAIGMKLKEVATIVNGRPQDLPRLDVDNEYRNTSGFRIEGNKIIISGQSTETVRLYYFKRPLQLTTLSLSGQITSINALTNEITLSNIPASWTTSTILNSVIKSQPFSTSAEEIQIVSLSAPTLVINSVEGLTVGDWVSEEGFSPIPQIPVEAHKVLAQATVVKCLEAMADPSGMEAANEMLERNLKDMLTIISPRVDGAPKKIVGRGIFSYSNNKYRKF